VDSDPVQEARLGRGRILVGGDVEELLDAANVRREPLVDRGLQFIRRNHQQGHHYFVTNPTEQSIDDWLEVAVNFQTVALLDPLTGTAGIAQTRRVPKNRRQIRLQLEPGQAMIVRTFEQQVEDAPWQYFEPAGDPIEIVGKWSVEFLEGGPELPVAYTTESLDSWTKSGDARAERFAGTARYSVTFDMPRPAKSYLLDRGHPGDSVEQPSAGDAGQSSFSA